jgi:hypothetical protein
MFSSTEELAAKLKSVRYVVAEEMLPARLGYRVERTGGLAGVPA